MTDNKLLEFPKGWLWVTLRDVAEDTKYAIVDGPFGSQMKVHEFTTEGIPLIEMQNLKGDKINLSFRRFITETKFKELERSKVKGDDIIVSKTGTLGLVAIVPKQIDEAMITSRLAKISLNENLITLKFAYYFMKLLRSSQYWEEVGKGTTMKILTIENIEDTHIPFPPLPEQHRIVAKIEELFTRLDAGIEALKKIKAQLKRYRQAVLKYAFEGKLTQEWREANKGKIEPPSVLLERIKEERKKDAKGKYRELPPIEKSDLPELPDSWVWARAEELCGFITKGTTPSPDKLYSNVGEVPFIKVYNLTDTGYLNFNINPTFISKQTHEGELNRSKVYADDILMNIVGPPLGKVSIVPHTHPEWNMNQAMAVFRSMPSFNRHYLMFCLPSKDILNRAIKKAKTTAGQSNLTLGICRDLPIPVPSLLEQHKIVEEIENRLSMADEVEKVMEQSFKQSDRLRQSILKQAFEGKLVLQDPTDEPAGKLLERIREEKAKRESSNKKEKKHRSSAANKIFGPTGESPVLAICPFQPSRYIRHTGW